MKDLAETIKEDNTIDESMDSYTKEWLIDHYGTTDASEYDVYWNVLEGDDPMFVVGSEDNCVSDDEYWNLAVLDYIESKLTGYEFDIVMEGTCRIIHRGNEVKSKSEINKFKRQMKATFPNWNEMDTNW